MNSVQYPKGPPPVGLSTAGAVFVIQEQVLGALTKLRKTTIGFVMSVCLSVRMEQLGSHWTDFHEI